MARGDFNGAVPAPSVEHGYHFHFGNVEKRVNSTKAFDYTKLPDEERCDFKQTTSIERPVIYVTLNSINISPQWNYCHCEETATFTGLQIFQAVSEAEAPRTSGSLH